MDIEALVKKHVRLYRAGAHYSVRVAMRAALMELASEYENDKTLRLVAVNLEVAELNERIRQVEAEKVPEDRYAFIDAKFRSMKSSTAERFLSCLGIEPPDDSGFDWSIPLAELLAAAPAQEKVAATYAGPSSTACDDQFTADIGDDMP